MTGFKPLGSTIPTTASNKASRSSTAKAKTEKAKTAVAMILGCYPDYGKVPPQYVASLVMVVETLADPIIDRLASRTTGIASRCTHLPTVAEITAMAGELSADFAAQSRYSEAQKRTTPYLPYFGKRAMPRVFPALWNAFEGTEIFDVLEAGVEFDRLHSASRALATVGTEAAARILKPNTEVRANA